MQITVKLYNLTGTIKYHIYEGPGDYLIENDIVGTDTTFSIELHDTNINDTGLTFISNQINNPSEVDPSDIFMYAFFEEMPESLESIDVSDNKYISIIDKVSIVEDNVISIDFSNVSIDGVDNYDGIFDVILVYNPKYADEHLIENTDDSDNTDDENPDDNTDDNTGDSENTGEETTPTIEPSEDDEDEDDDNTDDSDNTGEETTPTIEPSEDDEDDDNTGDSENTGEETTPTIEPSEGNDNGSMDADDDIGSSDSDDETDEDPEIIVTPTLPAPTYSNSATIIYDASNSESIITAALMTYILKEHDIDDIEYTKHTLFNILDCNKESVVLCNTDLGTGKKVKDIYNKFVVNALSIQSDPQKIRNINAFALGIHTVNGEDTVSALYKYEYGEDAEVPEALLYKDDAFTNGIIDMAIPGIDSVIDYVDAVVNGDNSYNEQTISEIRETGAAHIKTVTDYLFTIYDKYGSDTWTISKNRKAVVLLTGERLTTEFIRDDRFKQYDSIITIDHNLTGKWKIAIYNIMKDHVVALNDIDINAYNELVKELFNAGHYMHDKYNGNGDDVYGYAEVDINTFVKIVKSRHI